MKRLSEGAKRERKVDAPCADVRRKSVGMEWKTRRKWAY